jgi:dUTP pyrophosphatase
MKKTKIKIINNSNNPDPVYSTKGAAGMDIRAFLDEDIKITPHETYVIPTGIHVEIPKGYEIQVRSRSGLSVKSGLIVLNSPGTIDSDYRGEIKVILHCVRYAAPSNGGSNYIIKPGDRIAQLVLNKVETIDWEESFELKKTKRNTKGLGSTGVK